MKICLTMDREELYRRIEYRVDRMIEQGLLEEVKSLARRGFSLEAKSFKSIGYRQMVDYIHGRTGFDEAVSDIKKQTRRLAKRQLTWFRSEKDLVWIKTPDDTACIEVLIKKFLNIA